MPFQIQKPVQLALAALIAFSTVNALTFQKAQADDIQAFCQQYPLSLNCRGYITEMPGENAKGDAEPVSELIKLRLETSGPDNEWIRIETEQMTDNRVINAYHTTRIRRGLLSDVANGAIGTTASLLSPLPVPFGVNFHRWEDHPTLSLAFKPDECPTDLPQFDNQRFNSRTCLISGAESLILPVQLNIHEGVFTIEYQEKDLIRTITFRLPLEDS
jgi:hypothetical protein